jgi:hypothetical protein
MKDGALVASLGLPVRRRESAPSTYVTPSIRRKSPARQDAGRPAASETVDPAMSADDYEHVLRVVRGMVGVMEQSPHAFELMGEEDLRQHFLVQLNGQYERTATGETFNFEGKTDILIRERGRNLFLAECKFWRGPKDFSATIDQVLSYATWRDAKLAIIVFNRTKNLTKVLISIRVTATGHPSFVREIDYGTETDFRFVVRHPDDLERELSLTVLVFEVPGSTGLPTAGGQGGTPL